MIDPGVLPELIVYRIAMPPATIFKGIREMTGAQYLKLNAFAPEAYRTVMWSFSEAPRSSSDTTPSDTHCLRLLTQSVEAVSSRTDPVGVLFSGGLDSSLLAALAAKKQPHLTSLASSFSFINPEDQEGHYASTAANSLGLDIILHSATAEDYLRAIVYAVHAAEQPVHHLQSVLLHTLFLDPTIHKNELLICGESADGIFGSTMHERVFKYRALIRLLTNPAIRSVLKPLLSGASRIDPRFDMFTRRFDPNELVNDHVLWSLGQYTAATVVKDYFGMSVDAITVNRKIVMDAYTGRDLLDQISILGLLGDCSKTMRIWSKLAESIGCMLHFPFPDRDLIGHVLSVPWEEKLREPKHLIRQMLRELDVADFIINRPKRSFGFPPKYWALPNALLQPAVDMAAEYFGADLLAQLQVDDSDRAMALWTAINIYLVKRLLIDGADPDTVSEELIDRHMSRNNAV